MAVALIGAVPAAATTVAVTQQTGNIFGSQQWDLAVTYKKTEGTNQNFNVLAGAFQLHTNNWQGLPNSANFMAFCLTPFTTINLGGLPNYDVGSALSTQTKNLLGALAHGAWSKINSAVTAAAFQLAIWEIVVDGDKKLDFSKNGFQLNTMTGDALAARDLAQSWLDKIKANDPLFARDTTGLTFLSAKLDKNGNHKTQDLLTYTPPAAVPLPGAFGFLAVGLAALAAKGRARRV